MLSVRLASNGSHVWYYRRAGSVLSDSLDVNNPRHREIAAFRLL